MKGYLRCKTKFQIRRFKDGTAFEAGTPTPVIDETGKRLRAVSTFRANLGLREGIEEAWKLIIGGTATAFNTSNAQTGVGESSTAAADTDTDLLGSTKTYKAMDTSYPQIKGTGADVKVMVFKSTYGSSDANNAWNEFIVRNGATGLKDLIRKVSAQGTKVSGQTWELTIEITIA
jgi:hypothetical protein